MAPAAIFEPVRRERAVAVVYMAGSKYKRGLEGLHSGFFFYLNAENALWYKTFSL